MNDIKKLMLPIIFMALLSSCNNGNSTDTNRDSTGTRDTDSSDSVGMVTTRTLCPSPESSDLGMEVIGQEESTWCWAACGEMVIEKVKDTSITQCDQVTERFPENGNCCGQARPAGCQGGDWPDFDRYGLNSDTTRNDEPLPWDTIRNQIDCKKAPICVSWHLARGNGHMAVVSAYKVARGVRFLYKLDPEFGGSVRWITYDRYRVGPDLQGVPMYTHWKDFYNIEKK